MFVFFCCCCWCCFVLFVGWDYNGEFTSVVASKCRIGTNSFAINIDILLTLSRLDCPPLNYTFFSPLWGHPYVDEESKSHRHKNNCTDFVCIKAKATLHGFMLPFSYVILCVGFRVSSGKKISLHILLRSKMRFFKIWVAIAWGK